MNRRAIRSVLTVTLNPTCDRVIQVPNFEVGSHLKGHLVSKAPAGKAFNVSKALATLCIPNTAVGWIGEDTLEAFVRAAQDQGVTPRFTAISGHTRENITIIDPVRRTETHLRDVGPIVEEKDVTRLLTELAGIADASTLMIFTGSLPPGLTPARFGDMLDACIARSAMVAVDTSGAALQEAAARRIWLIKPNLDELTELTGRELADDVAIIKAGQELHRDIPLVIVSLGERGAICFCEEGMLRGSLVLPAEEIRSTVGCGDALLAGFIAGLIAPPGDIQTAFRQGLAAAAASATHALAAVFTREEVETLTPQVTLKPTSVDALH